ncbi:hypothetical protein F2Q68_00043559 [Brassica cretica]|uniref:Uncharacterized protein n=2 Tax=Brassica cretica TaxID=69181 RepID=A0ABQ7ANY5_BRACR|nr:hypothetical protein F2Q68_00043559 [Brassica cretica]KAF3515704.1 hypothetical protein DY000_02059229 [Brassica cretica]
MRFHLRLSFFIIILYIVSINPKLIAGDNNPPTPSPTPEPHPDDESSLSCVDDLGGIGSLDSTYPFLENLNNKDSVEPQWRSGGSGRGGRGGRMNFSSRHPSHDLNTW